MIVNVNPYDTSYEELVHVMAFSAIAQDVKVNPTLAASRAAARVSERRKVTLSIGGTGGKGTQRGSEMRLEVLEGSF